MLSAFQGDQDLDRIGARLTSSGAAALLRIHVEPLSQIERRHGAVVHRRVLEELMRLVREFARTAVPSDDIIVSYEQQDGAILAFLFRPRSDFVFYGSWLREFSGRLCDELSRQGRRAVYPYHRDRLALVVGTTVVLHNPGTSADRQILQALDTARRDADLEVGLKQRGERDLLVEVLLSQSIVARYEPIVDLRNQEIIGYEALARGPKGSPMESPGPLFRMAASAGLLFELDCLCRRMALEQSHFLPRGRKLFINCLPTSIADPSLRDEGLRKTLETYQLRPNDLVLEISENESIDNFAMFREMRDACQEIGIEIAVDDAGSGYASLEAIMEISPDFIKTDMGLVRGIDSDPPRQEILRALNSVAQGIGAQVIAEGIETEEELRVLRELSIPFGQGFLFGPALHAETEPTGD